MKADVAFPGYVWFSSQILHFLKTFFINSMIYVCMFSINCIHTLAISRNVHILQSIQSIFSLMEITVP